VRLTKSQQLYIKELAFSNGGKMTPDLIIADAKKKRSPLHGLFEWDLKKAAHQHWLVTARTIITSVTVVCTEHTITIPTNAYIEDPDKPRGSQGYVSTVTLRSDKEKARRALVRELERAESFMQRAYNVAAAVGLSDEVESILAQIRSIARSA